MVTRQTFLNGLRKGLRTTWEISKITVPLYIVITLLKYSGALAWLARVFAPAMSLFGLPGEAAVALVSGYLLNLYAAIGAMLPLDLTAKQITTIGLMLCLAHSLILETGITKKTGVKVSGLAGLRLGLSFLSGAILNLLV